MVASKFNEIYEKVISLWPEAVDVVDKTIHDSGRATIPNLVSEHDKVDEALEKYFLQCRHATSEYTDWCRHVDWAIYTVLHKQAREKACEVVYPHKLDKDEILKLCLECEQ